MNSQPTYDVIIVGGSAAGLSAAMTLGRSLRNVLIIDSGKPCNRQTPHAHNFMTRDGETPAKLTAVAREQALAYPTVKYRDSKVVTLIKSDVGFSLTTEQQEQFWTRKVLLATGVEDIMPPIGGFAECWGRSVLHCPYCHGYEVHDQPLGVLAHPSHLMMQVPLIRHWSKNLTLFTNGTVVLTDEQRDTIGRMNVPIVEKPIRGIRHQNGFMSALTFDDNSEHTLTAMFAAVPFRQHTDLAGQTGCTLTDAGLIAVGPFGETSVPGLYAAGDNSSLLRQLASASASGGTAGAGLNRELITDEVPL